MICGSSPTRRVIDHGGGRDPRCAVPPSGRSAVPHANLSKTSDESLLPQITVPAEETRCIVRHCVTLSFIKQSLLHCCCLFLKTTAYFEDTSPFSGPLETSFDFSYVCPDCMLHHLNLIDYSDSHLVRQLPTSWRPTS